MSTNTATLLNYAKHLGNLYNGIILDNTYKKLIDSLTENLREETVKSQNAGKRKNPLSIVKRVFKKYHCSQYNTNMFEKMQPLEYNGKSYECFTNGYYILCDSKLNYGYKVSEKPLNVLSCIQGMESSDYISFEIDKVKLEMYAKENKQTMKKTPQPYIIKVINDNDTFFVGVNAQYLLDSLNFCNTEKISVCNKNVNTIYPIYITSASMEQIAMVLPVNLGYDSLEDALNYCKPNQIIEL